MTEVLDAVPKPAAIPVWGLPLAPWTLHAGGRRRRAAGRGAGALLLHHGQYALRDARRRGPTARGGQRARGVPPGRRRPAGLGVATARDAPARAGRRLRPDLRDLCERGGRAGPRRLPAGRRPRRRRGSGPRLAGLYPGLRVVGRRVAPLPRTRRSRARGADGPHPRGRPGPPLRGVRPAQGGVLARWRITGRWASPSASRSAPRWISSPARCAAPRSESRGWGWSGPIGSGSNPDGWCPATRRTPSSWVPGSPETPSTASSGRPATPPLRRRETPRARSRAGAGPGGVVVIGTPATEGTAGCRLLVVIVNYRSAGLSDRLPALARRRGRRVPRHPRRGRRERLRRGACAARTRSRSGGWGGWARRRRRRGERRVRRREQRGDRARRCGTSRLRGTSCC